MYNWYRHRGPREGRWLVDRRMRMRKPRLRMTSLEPWQQGIYLSMKLVLVRVRLVLRCWSKLGALLDDLGCIRYMIHHIGARKNIQKNITGKAAFSSTLQSLWKEPSMYVLDELLQVQGLVSYVLRLFEAVQLVSNWNLSLFHVPSTLGSEAFWCWKSAVLQRNLRLRTGLEWDIPLSRISQGSQGRQWEAFP